MAEQQTDIQRLIKVMEDELGFNYADMRAAAEMLRELSRLQAAGGQEVSLRINDTDTFPVGTKALAAIGGHWYKLEGGGWKWNGPTGSGGTYPRPGGDWRGDIELPVASAHPPAAAALVPLTEDQKDRMIQRHIREMAHISKLITDVERHHIKALAARNGQTVGQKGGAT